MSQKIKFACWGLVILFCCKTGYGQSIDSAANKLANFPTKLFGRIESKTASLDQQLTKQTEKYLQRMAKREDKLRKKLSAVDSNAAKNLFAGSADRYAALVQKLKNDTGSRATGLSGEYRPFTDSLKGTLAFLQQNQQLLGTGSAAGNSINPATLTQLQGASCQLQALQAKMQDADQVSQFLQQRQTQIGQYLSKYTQLPSGLTNTYNGYNQQIFYYKQQVQEYKNMLNDPDKQFRTALALLNKVPAFTNFMKSNSVLSGLFNMGSGPSLPGTPGAAQPVVGLATRDQVMAALQNKMGSNSTGSPGTGGTSSPGAGGAGDIEASSPEAGGYSLPNASGLAQQNIGSAQGQIDQLRSGGGGNGDPSMPDFKPNGQKTRSFLRRLEIGTNLQTTHSNYFFPTTTDVGLSLGYKLTDNNDVGIGASYKIGWGTDINHIRVGSQGVGLRSFVDIQLKKSFFATGGFEYNYQLPFSSLKPLKDLCHWQQSGLLGVSKVVSMKNKVFKNTKIQLLWDFLSYQQIPQTQPFLFRIGYTF